MLRTLIALTLLVAARAHANAPPPVSPADLVGDPAFPAGVAVVSRAVELDLTPLAERHGAARARASWVLRVEAPQRVTLDLVAPGAPTVTLDGEVVAVGPPEQGPPPTGWPGGDDPDPLRSRDAAQLRQVALTLAPGEHTLVQAFGFTAGLDRRAGPALVHRVVWALGPGLPPADVRVATPPGWEVTASPTLSEAGAGVLSGQLQANGGLALTLSLHAPWGGSGDVAETLAAGLGLLVLGGGWLVVRRVARGAVQAGRSPWGPGALAIVSWAVALGLVTALLIEAPRLGYGLPAAQHAAPPYRGIFFGLLGCLAIALAVVAGLVTVALCGRRPAREAAR